MARQAAKDKSAKDGLNVRQLLFVKHYLITRNVTESACLAGYSKKTAAQIGNRLLRNVQIQALINKSEQKMADKLEITHERILTELAKIGFSDIRQIVQWGAGLAVYDKETGEAGISNGVSLIDSKEISDDAAGSICEISQTAQGVKVKMYDKRAALVDLGKHLGMFKDKIEVTGANGGAIEQHSVIDVASLSKDQLRLLASIPVRSGK